LQIGKNSENAIHSWREMYDKRYMIYYPCISRLTGEEKSSNTLRDEQNLRGLKKKKISTT